VTARPIREFARVSPVPVDAAIRRSTKSSRRPIARPPKNKTRRERSTLATGSECRTGAAGSRGPAVMLL